MKITRTKRVFIFIMFSIVNSEIISRNCKEKLRPNASHGLWLSILIPLSYLINTAKHRTSLEFQYKLSTIIAFGLAIESVFIFGKLASNRKSNLLNVSNHLLAGGVTSFLVWICLKQDTIFSIFIGYTIISMYRFLYFFTLRRLPHSLTLGEASILCQGLTLFLLNSFLKFVDYPYRMTMMQQMTTILEVTFLGVTIIVGLTYAVPLFRGILFYFLTFFVVGLVLIFPLTDHSIVFVVLAKFIFGDLKRIFMISLWIGLLGVTCAGVAYHVTKQYPSTTRTRKLFHILMVIVFIPGLLYQCTFLFIAAGLLFAAFIMLETVRLIQLPPFYPALHDAICTFVDEKDAGALALTPIYLLAGCCIPLWLHPCPCDLTDSVGFSLLPLSSGILSVGIGDTVASVVGSKYGNHKWTGTSKSIEGTVASMLTQSLVFIFCIYFGFTSPQPGTIIVFEMSVIANAFIEAKTNQIDNLVLPIVTFCILSIC